MEKLGFLNSWKSLIILGIFSRWNIVADFIFQSIPDEWLGRQDSDRQTSFRLLRYIVGVPAAKPAE